MSDITNSNMRLWKIIRGDGPIVATAIHSGHDLRDEIAAKMALSGADRLREEDPFTDEWTIVGDTQIVATRSRFEVDLNRLRQEAVYVKPEDAWGLHIWKTELTQGNIDDSLMEHDQFYQELAKIFSDLTDRYRFFVVLDLHSYNHRRGGPEGEADEPSRNPEVNIGTGSMKRNYWANLVDQFINDLREFDFMGRNLDVRENVKFLGRELAGWTHKNYPKSGCVLSIEIKKFFMDEWTGKPLPEIIEAIGKALQSTTPGIRKNLERMKK